MTSPATHIRINKAVAVLIHVEEGMTVTKACREVGIPRRTYYDICVRHPHIVANFIMTIEESAREQLFLILIKRSEVLQKLVDEGIADTTKPRERLAIFKALEGHLEKLVGDLRMNSLGDEDALEVLSGPILQPAVSRFTPYQVITPGQDNAWE